MSSTEQQESGKHSAWPEMTFERGRMKVRGPPNHVAAVVIALRVLTVIGALLTGGDLVWRLFGH